MTSADRKEVEMVAKLAAQQFFSHYLEEVFPAQLTAAVTAHNRDVTAHAPQIKGAIDMATARLKLWVLGLVFGGGIGLGVGASRAIAALSGS